MRSQVIYSHGDPGTFDITDKDNPLYYIARYCHECSEDRYELNADGFVYEQYTQDELVTYANSLDTALATVATWMKDAVDDSEAGTAIEATPWIAAPKHLGDGTGFTAIWIRFLVRVALAWIRQKLDSDTDSTEIAQVLKRAFLDEDGAGDEYALIKQMANTPLEIVVSKADGFEDISYADRPET